MSDLNILAIIPARGGSKDFLGKILNRSWVKPLIAWTIEQTKKSLLINTVIVNTDSPQIAKVSKLYGADTPFVRPARLATDAVKCRYGFAYIEILCRSWRIIRHCRLLEPTSPLRADDDIDKALASLIKNFATMDGLVSVGAVHLEKPDILKKVDHGIVAPLFKKSSSEGFFLRRHIRSKNAGFQEASYLPKKTLAYPIERWQNYEIDDIYDFLCVEAVLKNRLALKDT